MARLEIYPHDLLTFSHESDFQSTKNPLPDWAKDSLRAAKIVVVRRGAINQDKIPVGLRGKQKSQRLAGFLKKQSIVKYYHPDYFIKQRSWQYLEQSRQEMPAFKALIKIIPLLNNFKWGISGSLAYEMATRIKMVHQSSDLDIIAWQVPQMSIIEARKLLSLLNNFKVHADMQIVNGQRGFALEEYANHRDNKILVKTDEGPKLTENPWQFIKEG